MNNPSSELSLCDLPANVPATVSQVLSTSNPGSEHLVLRLIEIGFLPGEQVRIIAHGHPGREPIAVRLGHTTFALRRFEAAFIRVRPDSV